MNLDDAYAIQALLTASRVARGEHLVGWKLGYTSAAMRAQMGIDAPNAGPLTDAMALPDGAAVPPAALDPLVEPEIAVRLGSRLPPDATTAHAMEAIDHAWAALEVCDPIWEGRRFTLEENTADGSSAAWFVLGDSLPPERLDAVAVTFSHNAIKVGSTTGAAVGGHPLAGLCWLARQLSTRGGQLEAGSIILTGGLTAAVDLAPGDVASAEFTPITGSVARASVRGSRWLSESV